MEPFIPTVSTASRLDNYRLSTIAHNTVHALAKVTRTRPWTPAETTTMETLLQVVEDLLHELATTEDTDWPGELLEGPFIITDAKVCVCLKIALEWADLRFHHQLTRHLDEMSPEMREAVVEEQDKVKSYLSHLSLIMST